MLKTTLCVLATSVEKVIGRRRNTFFGHQIQDLDSRLLRETFEDELLRETFEEAFEKEQDLILTPNPGTGFQDTQKNADGKSPSYTFGKH